MAKGKEVNQEIQYLKLDILDRLAGYDLDLSKLRSYENDLRAIVDMPPQRRKAQFNKLLDKIRSVCKRQGAKENYE